jgi:hypothetical protein
MQGQEKESFLETLSYYNNILGDDEAYTKAWFEFCEKEKAVTLLKHYMPFHFRGMRKIGRMLNPELLFMPSRHNRKVKLNTIRCESHLELLRTVLSGEFDE